MSSHESDGCAPWGSLGLEDALRARVAMTGVISALHNLRILDVGTPPSGPGESPNMVIGWDWEGWGGNAQREVTHVISLPPPPGRRVVAPFASSQLRVLAITANHISQQVLTNEQFSAVDRSCPNIVGLSLIGILPAVELVVGFITRRPCLLGLKFHDDHVLDCGAASGMHGCAVDSDLWSALGDLKSLRLLSLGLNCKMPSDSSPIRMALQHMKRLEYLALALMDEEKADDVKQPQVVDDFVLMEAARLPSIRSINIDAPARLTEAAFAPAVWGESTSLRALDITPNYDFVEAMHRYNNTHRCYRWYADVFACRGILHEPGELRRLPAKYSAYRRLVFAKRLSRDTSPPGDFWVSL